MIPCADIASELWQRPYIELDYLGSEHPVVYIQPKHDWYTTRSQHVEIKKKLKIIFVYIYYKYLHIQIYLTELVYVVQGSMNLLYITMYIPFRSLIRCIYGKSKCIFYIYDFFDTFVHNLFIASFHKISLLTFIWNNYVVSIFF